MLTLTLPSELREFVYRHQAWFYDLMFRAAADVLNHFAHVLNAWHYFVLLTLQYPIILRVSANPYPVISVILYDCQRSVALRNSHGPQLANRFELERGMLRITLPKTILLPGSFLDLRREVRVFLPKLNRG
jgi:hypothetical protein